jgi:hypothetical protein
MICAMAYLAIIYIPMKLIDGGMPWWSSILLIPPIWLAFKSANYCANQLFARTWDAKYGVCAQCGYDLSATPSRCPECGTIPLESHA